MEWINLGYDLRVPFARDSTWKVGDLRFCDFTQLLSSLGSRIRRIVSFDLNMTPRPNAIFSNRPGSVDLAYGGYPSSSKIPGIQGARVGELLVYWQVEKRSYERALEAGWFSFLPGEGTQVPVGWQCIGIDVVNDQGLSEYWDTSEAFWDLDPRLSTAVNADGLVEDEQLLMEVLPLLPLDPANQWVMPVRAWISS